MTVPLERFEALCRREPARPLIHLPANATTWTANDLWVRSLAYRDALCAAGVRRGDAVLCATGNQPATVALFLACWQLEATVLPVDVSTPRNEIQALGSRFGTRVTAVRRSDVADLAAPAWADEAAAVLPGASPADGAGHGAAVLKLTSGSSGEPKAATCTTQGLTDDTDRIVAAMGITPDDVQMAAVPFSHAYGLSNLVMPLLLQGTAIVVREAFVPHLLPADARHYRARVFHGVPFMFQHYLDNPPSDGWPSCLSLLVSAAARLDLHTRRAFHSTFGVKIHSFYGASETGGIAFDARDDMDDLEHVGTPMPGVAVTLRAEDGLRPPHGRVHVRASSVTQGYVGCDGAAPPFADDGFLTGDFGYFDAAGRLVLVGRMSSFINVAGRKVQPAEVEQVLLELPGVDAARAVGVPDAVRGEQIGVVIAHQGGLTSAAVRLHCARRLAPFKIPRVIVLVDKLPLTARGKTDLRAIEALVAARVSPQSRSRL